MGYNTATHTFDTFQDLRLAVGDASSSVTVLGQSNVYDSLGGTFLWNANPSFLYPDDNYTIIKPNIIGPETPGRWIRVTTADTLSGTWEFTGDGVTSTFTFNFPVEYQFLSDEYRVFLQPTTQPAAAIANWISLKTFTSFSATFVTPPPVTAGFGIKFDYLIRYTPNINDL